eukprot:scaffold113024_cov30-Phaeocystis_antarctica.AAC.1
MLRLLLRLCGARAGLGCARRARPRHRAVARLRLCHIRRPRRRAGRHDDRPQYRRPRCNGEKGHAQA